MTQNDLRQNAENEMNDFRKSTKFPAEYITDTVIDWSRKALAFIPILSNPITAEEFKALYNPEDVTNPYTIEQMGQILKSMQGRNMKDMGMDAHEYAMFIEYYHKLHKVYEDIVSPKAEEIRSRYEEEAAKLEKGGKKTAKTIHLQTGSINK